MLRTFAEPGRVRRLDATNNRLATLPHWLFHRFAGLQQLTLSHNRLTALPAELGLLTSLKVRLRARNTYSSFFFGLLRDPHIAVCCSAARLQRI